MFAFDDDEIATVIEPDHDLDDTTVMRIAHACPGQAVIVTDASGVVVDL